MWPFKQAPAPTVEKVDCEHIWDKWTKPVVVPVTSHSLYGYSGGSVTKEYKSWAQDRYCLRCNIIERRVAS
jgi:hypothetical protein